MAAFLHKLHIYKIRVILYVPHTKYFSRDQIKKNEMSGACGTNGVRRGSYRVLVGKPEGERPYGRPKRRRGDNMKMGLQEMRWVSIGWINLTQDRNRWRAFVNAVMEPSGPIKCGGISWLSEDLLASQERVCSMESISLLVILQLSVCHFLSARLWR